MTDTLIQERQILQKFRERKLNCSVSQGRLYGRGGLETYVMCEILLGEKRRRSFPNQNLRIARQFAMHNTVNEIPCETQLCLFAFWPRQ